MRSYIHVHDVIHVHNIYTSNKITTNIVAKVLSDHRTFKFNMVHKHEVHTVYTPVNDLIEIECSTVVSISSLTKSYIR